MKEEIFELGLEEWLKLEKRTGVMGGWKGAGGVRATASKPWLQYREYLGEVGP